MTASARASSDGATVMAGNVPTLEVGREGKFQSRTDAAEGSGLTIS